MSHETPFGDLTNEHPNLMPYTKCPICGQTSHLNVADPVTWYAERYPDLDLGDLVAAPCFYCFPSIETGDAVVIRSHFTQHPDFAAIASRGIVTRITTSDAGHLFHLQLDGGDDVFVRGEIRKPRDDE